MALAGDQHVVISIGAVLHRPAGGLRQQRGDTGKQRCLGLLAAKATAHATTLHHHPMRFDAQRMRHLVLHFARMLGGVVHQHLTVFARQGVGDLPFEIELLLSADDKTPAQPLRRAGQGGSRIALRQPHAGQDKRAGTNRAVGIENRR